MKKYYWTMKNGQKTDIDLMDENHLRNTLKMILRNIENAEAKEREIRKTRRFKTSNVYRKSIRNIRYG